MKPTLSTIINQVVNKKLKDDQQQDAELLAAKKEQAHEVVQKTLYNSRLVFDLIEQSEAGTAFKNGVSDALVIVATIPDHLQLSETFTPVATLAQLGEKARHDIALKITESDPWQDSDEPEETEVAYYNGLKHVLAIFEGVWFG